MRGPNRAISLTGRPRIRPSPSDTDSALFGPLVAPAPCSGDHSDLDHMVSDATPSGESSSALPRSRRRRDVRV
jgi:hypothetical protein